MSKSRLQISAEYLIARIVLAIFGALPLRSSMRLGSTLARVLLFFRGRLRRTGEKNLSIAFPNSSSPERAQLLSECIENLGRLLGVFSHFSDRHPESLKSIIECEGLDRIDAAQRLGRGVILFTGHLGAWELSSFALSLFDRPLSFLVRRIDNPRVEALIDRARTSRGNRTIDKRSAAREMMQTLRQGGTLGILVDLNTQEREGIFVDFFGVKASTTFLVAKLALRTNAEVLPVFVPWEKERERFLLKIEAPLQIERTANEAEDVRALTQLLTSVVEQNIRCYPDQWLWIHRRWKTRPPGEPGLYD